MQLRSSATELSISSIFKRLPDTLSNGVKRDFQYLLKKKKKRLSLKKKTLDSN